MKIMEILATEAVVLDLEASSKAGVLAEVAEALAKAVPGVEADAVRDVLQAREDLQSTGIGDGVAIPHGKLAGLDKLVASFARSRGGLDFDAIDGQPTELFFILLVPEQAGGGQHLKALARISRFFRDEEFRAKLLGAGSREDVVAAIEEADGKF